MMISRWDPFRELSTLQDRINRVFNEQLTRGEGEKAGKSWAPVVDILESESDLIVRAELPGVMREDVDVGPLATEQGLRETDGFITGPNDEIKPFHSAISSPVKNINSSSLNIGYAYV